MPPRACILTATLLLSFACDKGETEEAKPSSAETKAKADDSPSGFTAYKRRSQTSEARVQLAKLFDSASAYFMEEHVERGELSVIGQGGSIAEVAPHQCPNDGKPEGSTGITPPLSVDCNEGPEGRCVPVAGEPKGPGQYSMKLWTDNPVWNDLNFMQEQAHYFHYEFSWKNDPKGYGGCEFTIQAFGDLDDDEVFSTFERKGKAHENGIDGAELKIDNEME